MRRSRVRIMKPATEPAIIQVFFSALRAGGVLMVGRTDTSSESVVCDASEVHDVELLVLVVDAMSWRIPLAGANTNLSPRRLRAAVSDNRWENEMPREISST